MSTTGEQNRRLLFDPEMSIKEAARDMSHALDDGLIIECPVCWRDAKIHKRSINGGMAKSLVKLYRLDRLDPGCFLHVKVWVDKDNREHGRLAAWGLIEEETERREDGGRQGFWCITERGRAYVEGRLTVPKQLAFYDARVLGVADSTPVTIRDAFGKKFRFDELMNGFG